MKKLKKRNWPNREIDYMDGLNAAPSGVFAVFPVCLILLIYSVYVCFRHRPLKTTLTTKTTCDDEAEALKAAPPWRGVWATKPTFRQRGMAWVNYLRYR
jgi:hypothetical protein